MVLLRNAPINIGLNFNFEKLVKYETSLCSFSKVVFKGGENILECLKSLLESETPSCGFDRVGLKRGQNSSKHRKSWHACLSIQYASKPMIMFQF